MKSINIKIKESVHIKDKKSAYISFKFDFDALAKVKNLPLRYYHPDTKEWEVPVDDLTLVENDFKDFEIKGEYKKELKSDSVPEPKKSNVDLEFKTKPFEHQLQGVEYALKSDKFLLADEQGLGKTKQAIDIAIAKRKQTPFKHCLIVCGVNSLKHNWLKEVSTHSDESAHILGQRTLKNGKTKDGTLQDRLDDLKEGRDEFFLVTNIESLRKPTAKKDKKTKKVKPLSKTQQVQLDIITELEKMTKDGTIGMVVIDEIHKAKNSQTQQGKAIHYLKSPFKLALTGTPLMNKPIDLYNILKWLNVEKHSFYQFRNRYCIMGGYGGYEIVEYKNLKELQTKLEKIMLRRKKEDVLDLPPKIRSTEYVEMSPKQAQIYKEVKNSISQNLDQIKLSPNPLAQLIRLRQATAHTAILSDKISESAKFDRLKEILEELAESGKKAIIFTNWTSVTDRLIPEIDEYNPAVITGDTKDRQAEVERFQEDDSCKVIVGTIAAMGTGLTLTAASTVIFLDKPWNMANTEQAEDRAHRIGTKGTVNIVTLVCKGTIDEQIESIIQEKAEMGEGLVEGNDTVLAKYDKSELVDRLLS